MEGEWPRGSWKVWRQGDRACVSLWASDVWDTLPFFPYKRKGRKEYNQKTEQVNVIPFQHSVRHFGNTVQKAAAGDVRRILGFEGWHCDRRFFHIGMTGKDQEVLR